MASSYEDQQAEKAKGKGPIGSPVPGKINVISEPMPPEPVRPEGIRQPKPGEVISLDAEQVMKLAENK
jgi:hypothetical protein